MLLNIDKPLRSATLHADGCAYVPNPLGTQFKPVGDLGRDGGWFHVESEPQGRKLAVEKAPKATVIRCQHC